VRIGQSMQFPPTADAAGVAATLQRAVEQL